MLAEPPRTPYDLNFRLFGFDVRVHPLFWLAAVLLGLRTLELGLEYLLIWVVVFFITLLVHELGHALAFRRYGSDARIVLHMFFGLAIGSPDVRSRPRRIMVSLAGPMAGFALAAILYLSHQATRWGSSGSHLGHLYDQLMFLNLLLGVLNLFPVFPLDGGQISRELCEAKRPGRGLLLSLQISVGTGAAVAVYSLLCELTGKPGGLLAAVPWWLQGTYMIAILFALLAVQNYLLLQQVTRGGGYYYEGPDDDRPPWK